MAVPLLVKMLFETASEASFSMFTPYWSPVNVSPLMVALVELSMATPDVYVAAGAENVDPVSEKLIAPPPT